MTISTTGVGEAHGFLSLRGNRWTHVAILRSDRYWSRVDVRDRLVGCDRALVRLETGPASSARHTR